ncbi:MAG: hypothetical protein AAGF11_45455 [Myxococcota bacterium]
MHRPSLSRPASKNPEIHSAFAAAGRAVAAKATAVATVAMVLVATLPRPAMAGPADIDTNYGGRADIDTNYQDGSTGSARALTVEGQASFDAGDYVGAAASWKKILDILPENDLNREERENALLISLEAYKQAFRRVSVQSGSVGNADVELLREALRLCDAYTKEVARVHGPTAVSPSVVESRVEIEGMLANTNPVEAPPPPIITPDTGGIVLEPDVIRRGKSGTGLIAAGSVSIVVGLAMMPLVIIGSIRLRDANDRIQRAEEIDPPTTETTRDKEDAEDQQRSANAMIISGSILMGVLTIGGATMLGIGIRRRIRYTAFSPVVGPSYAGFSLQRRF